MIPATKTTPAAWANWHWPEDVLAFAKEHQVDTYLEPLKDALARLLPNAKRARVILELDPEIRDDRHITFKIDVPDEDIPESTDYLKVVDAWHAESMRIVPSVKLWVFRMILYPVE
jgi:hypothetical protein